MFGHFEKRQCVGNGASGLARSLPADHGALKIHGGDAMRNDQDRPAGFHHQITQHNMPAIIQQRAAQIRPGNEQVSARACSAI